MPEGRGRGRRERDGLVPGSQPAEVSDLHQLGVPDYAIDGQYILASSAACRPRALAQSSSLGSLARTIIQRSGAAAVSWIRPWSASARSRFWMRGSGSLKKVARSAALAVRSPACWARRCRNRLRISSSISSSSMRAGTVAAPRMGCGCGSMLARAGVAERVVARLNGVEERVLSGRAALGPLRKAVAAGAFVFGSHVDRARGSALDDLSLDACASQRTVG